MQKKLKLTVMALCFAPMAFAQTPKSPDINSVEKEEESEVVSEQAFTFTEAQLGEDDDMSQNVSIISSNQNVYASQVGYTFSPVRFRYRAFNQKYNEIYINGALMNDMESGQFRYALVGGLNQQTRGVENSLPFEFNNFSMPGMGGSNNYDFRPSHMATGQRVTLSGANRNYTIRAMYTYNTGLRPDGWAFSANVTYRWADMNTSYIDGTFYNALSYFFGAEKKFGNGHALSIVTWGNPTERAAQGAGTDEMYWLANSNFYNPNWGYQNGKKRSSRVVNDFAPTLMLTWDWDINDKTKLTTSLTGRYSWYKNTKLNYNGGENPAPDYWKNMPSSYYDVWNEDDFWGRTQTGYNDFEYARIYLMDSKANRQINWDRLYYANQTGNLSGRDAAYFVQAKHNDNFNIALSSSLKKELSKTTTWNVGLQLAHNTGMHYQTMEDLLGANTFHNINTYALGKYSPTDPRVQYDLNNRDAEVKEGDRFGYDYNLLVRKAQLWSSMRYNKGALHSFIAGRIGGVTIQRDGKMRNGMVADFSYGKSGVAKFLDGGAKAGLAYKFAPGNTVTLGAGFELKAPQAQAAFVSPEMTNDFVDNLKNEKVFSSELGYQFETSWLKANVGGYYNYITDVTEWQNYFDDIEGAFTYVSMTGIKKAYYGLEWGVKIKLNSAFSIRTIGTISEAKNMNNSSVRFMNSTEGTYHDDIVYNKNMRESGTPLSAYNLTLSYSAKGWFIDVSGNYYHRIYLSYSPVFRYQTSLEARQQSWTQFYDANHNQPNLGNDPSKYIVTGEQVYYTAAQAAQDPSVQEGQLLPGVIDQQKSNGGFMLDLSIGKSIRMKKGQLSINLSLSNVLNNTRLCTGGYEQGRMNFSGSRDAEGNVSVGSARLYKFDKNPKKFYAYGINGMLNIGYRF
jgi:hypothetical protein